ncbi:MAG: hypothetical protein V1755_10870 [Chloroflexota bacterium]
MRRAVPLALVGVGMLLLLTTGGWLVLDTATRRPAAIPLPKHIADLSMSSEMTGTQATEEFDMLHGQQFPLTAGSVGIYGEGQATLWIAGAPFGFMAANLVSAMRDRIAEGRSPFAPVREIQDGGRVVYELEGMGQKHFYFQSKNLVIWLAADPAIADVAVHQILEAYP